MESKIIEAYSIKRIGDAYVSMPSMSLVLEKLLFLASTRADRIF